jgi:hypothetical protein
MNSSEKQMENFIASRDQSQKFAETIEAFYLEAVMTQNNENIYTLFGNMYLKSKEVEKLGVLFTEWTRKTEEIEGKHGEEWQKSTTEEITERINTLYTDSTNHIVKVQKVITEDLVHLNKIVEKLSAVEIRSAGARLRIRAFMQFFGDKITTRNKQLAQIRKDLDFMSKQSQNPIIPLDFANNTALEYKKQLDNAVKELEELTVLFGREVEVVRALLPDVFAEFEEAKPALQKELDARVQGIVQGHDINSENMQKEMDKRIETAGEDTPVS